MQDKILDLIKLLTDFQNVERGVTVPGMSRKENDTEHSYNLAMAAWIIITKDNLPLDINRILRYALVHDLVELYAGDSFALDSTRTATKADREAAAMKQLEAGELTHELADDIRAYEELADEEAKFVYALDKLMPAFGILYGRASTWKDHSLTPSEWEAKFRTKIETSQYAIPYLEFVIEEQKNHPELFASSLA